ncbi:hypothetical protein MUK42_06317 [Musa troglodytarum]|nr:hypothetical protein MUK42_06317 [Musa troglodytarum]
MASETGRRKLPVLCSLRRWIRTSKKSKNSPEKQEDDREKKGAMRLKVMVSKKEAAQLLAMYVRGEEEMVAKIVSELQRRTEAGQQVSSSDAWRPMLESIPED